VAIGIQNMGLIPVVGIILLIYLIKKVVVLRGVWRSLSANLVRQLFCRGASGFVQLQVVLAMQGVRLV
jgi:hypothetical protein